MKREFLKSSAVYVIGSVLTRGIYIFLIPVFTRYLSPGEYGVMDLFVAIAAIVNLTIALEIAQAVARFYQEAGRQNPAARMEYTSTAFWFTLLVNAVYFLVTFIFAEQIAVFLLESAQYRNIVILANGSIAAGGVFYFVLNQLKAQLQPRDSVVVSIVNALVVATLASYFLIVNNWKVEGVFASQIVSFILGSLVAVYFARGNYRLVFSFPKLKEMIGFSFPLVFSGIAIFVTLYIDRIAIKGLLGLEALGVYGLAYRFASIAGLVMVGFQSALTPLVYKYYKEEQTPLDIAKLFDGFIILALLVSIGAILFSREVVVLMAAEQFHAAEGLVALLVMAILLGNMYIFTPGLAIAKKTKTITFISIAGALLNVILNYTLIPVYGLIGAAAATLVSAALSFVLYVVLSDKSYSVPFRWKAILLSTVVSIVLGVGLKFGFSSISLLGIAIKSIGFVAIAFVLLRILVWEQVAEWNRRQR